MSKGNHRKQGGKEDRQVPLKLELSVVIPVYNEECSIESLLQEVHDALHGKQDFEIIVVDDGSCDQTVQVLKQYSQEIPEIKIIRHQRNFGQTAAILSGVKAAGAVWIATLDGDGQNDPADIEYLMEKVITRRDGQNLLIAGMRKERHDSWLRRISSRIANSVRQALLHDECPDTGCGLKVFERNAFLRLPKFDHMHRFLPALFKLNGGTVINVEVSHRPRTHGISKYGVLNRFWVGVIDLVGVIWLQHRPYLAELDNESN